MSFRSTALALMTMTTLTLGAQAPAFAADFKLTSPIAQAANGMLPAAQVYNDFGCTGGNVSPALSWEGAPAGTAAYAVTVYDPDAPTGSGFWHWVVVNLPASAKGVDAGAGAEKGGSLPAGALQIVNDYGKTAFGGACPPAGDKAHRYIFTVHALKQALPVNAQTPQAVVRFMMHGNSLASASFTLKYGR